MAPPFFAVHGVEERDIDCMLLTPPATRNGATTTPNVESLLGTGASFAWGEVLDAPSGPTLTCAGPRSRWMMPRR